MAFSKRKLTFICIGVYFFIEGVEYAVILPTLWLYIQSKFQAEEWFFGVILSSFSFSGLFAGILMGRWADKTGKTKFLVLISILWEIGGNFMYFVGYSKYFVLVGRLIAGVGIGGDSVLISEITRGTAEDGRTAVLSVMVAIAQLGLVLGPGFNVFLRLSNFHIGPFLVDKYTAPGAFMCLCWALVAVLFIFFYHGLAQRDLSKPGLSDSSIKSPVTNIKEVKKNVKEQSDDWSLSDVCNGSGIMDDSMQSKSDTITSQTQIVISSTEDDIHQQIAKERTNTAANHPSNATSKTRASEMENSSKLLFLYNEYIREEVITVLAIRFNCTFNQLSFETIITPLTKKYLSWGELTNSIAFCAAGVEIIFVFVIVRQVSKRFKDRTLLLFGCCSLGFSVCCLMYAVVTAAAGQTSYFLPKFIGSGALYSASVPFIQISCISLYSKITHKETQGLSQGIRKVISKIATILGPLWASSTLSEPYILFGVLLGLNGISFLAEAFVLCNTLFERAQQALWNSVSHNTRASTTRLFRVLALLSYKRLIPLSEIKSTNSSQNHLHQHEETKPLLS